MLYQRDLILFDMKSDILVIKKKDYQLPRKKRKKRFGHFITD